ncbi:hypothetical protein [uncultured Sphingomonas sp.]|uniref:hypothetical protein n=1 Tax=uncultured Sphingomonas sp. TaxID=158754 RepID=UPI0025F3747D|nr:hypothetical protein [uncultured Sphingomonas sp.]
MPEQAGPWRCVADSSLSPRWTRSIQAGSDSPISYRPARRIVRGKKPPNVAGFGLRASAGEKCTSATGRSAKVAARPAISVVPVG